MWWLRIVIKLDRELRAWAVELRRDPGLAVRISVVGAWPWPQQEVSVPGPGSVIILTIIMIIVTIC